jgi:hypothetical protein
MYFRYLGVLVTECSHVFGYNELVIKSANQFDSKLHKRHVVISFDHVREGMASDMVTMAYIPSHKNASGVLSKHWNHNAVWHPIQPHLFWQGDTMECYVSDHDCVARKEK